MRVFHQDRTSRFAARALPPVFVVGTPRSGTTLLASMLSGHSELACGVETFFFDQLARRDSGDLLRQWPKNAVSFLESLELEQEQVLALHGLRGEEVTAELERLPRRVASVLSALTGLAACKQGKPRWIEKTPGHLLHVQTIRRHYPQAAIVRIVRDPRDVALSLNKVPWASFCFVRNLSRCVQDFCATRRFFERDRRSLTVKFEELVADPEPTLRRICRLTGVEFEEAMLRERQTQLATRAETWKSKSGSRPDTGRLGVWRRTLSHDERQIANVLAFDLARYFDYARDEPPRRRCRQYEQGAPGGLSSRAMSESARRREQLLPVMDARGRALWPELSSADEVRLDGLPALGSTSAERLAAVAQLALVLSARKLSGRPTIVTHRDTPEGKTPWPTGKADHLAEWILRAINRSDCRAQPR